MNNKKKHKLPLFPPRGGSDSDSGENDWLVTYSDAVTLVLCFFIVLFSMSSPNTEQMKEIGGLFSDDGSYQKEKDENPFKTLVQTFQTVNEDSNLGNAMSVEETDRGLLLELSSSAFYEDGSAKSKRGALPTLTKVAQVLSEFNFDAYIIEAEGHTGDTPIKSEMFPSNWELSTARAANIIRFFIASGIKPEVCKSSGYAETRPKVPNFDDAGNPIQKNRDMNKRVVVRVERTDV